MKNALTIDVEDWYQTNGLDLPIASWMHYEDRVTASTEKLLQLLDRYGVKATFFVLGCVAARHPELVRSIAVRGHEIASHGGWHRMLHRLDEDQFRDDIRESKRILEQVSGRKVDMYRAPSWSITRDRYRYLRILVEEGYRVDSSLQPFRTPLSGVSNAPRRPFRPIVDGEELELIEYPSTILSVYKQASLPFSGGFYLRALPSWLIEASLKRVNRIGSGMIYLHPWELDPEQPRLPGLKPSVRVAQYYRLTSTESKLIRLLKRFELVPLGEVIEEERARYPAVTLD